MNFEDAKREVELRMGRGDNFQDVEAFINGLPAEEEQKAALWLIAWSEQEPHLQRRLAREYATTV